MAKKIKIEVELTEPQFRELYDFHFNPDYNRPIHYRALNRAYEKLDQALKDAEEKIKNGVKNKK